MSDIILISVITTLFTAALTYVGYWRHVEAELKKEYASRFNNEKWIAYKNFMIMRSRMVNSMKAESAEVKVTLLLVASDEVINAYNDSVSAMMAGDDEKKSVSDARLLAAMRKDLGYDTRINPDELLKMFLSIQEP
jgi:hypothetical protein